MVFGVLTRDINYFQIIPYKKHPLQEAIIPYKKHGPWCWTQSKPNPKWTHKANSDPTPNPNPQPKPN